MNALRRTGGYGWRVEVEQLTAWSRVILARQETQHILPGHVYSAAELTRQAEIFKLKATVQPVAYRFDRRAPEEIARAGGFFPPADKVPLTILEHSRPKSPGGNWVSTTTQEKNKYLLDAVSSTKIPATQTAVESRLAQLLPPQYQGKVRFVKEAKFSYEYKLTNVLGIDTSTLGAIEEAEHVAGSIPVSQISHSRRILYLRIILSEEPYYLEIVHADPWRVF